MPPKGGRKVADKASTDTGEGSGEDTDVAPNSRATPKTKAPKRKRATKSAQRAESSGDEHSGSDKAEALPKKKTKSKGTKATLSSAEGEDRDVAKGKAGKVTASAGKGTATAPRKRKKPSGPTLSKTPIPKTYEECSLADKMLVDWRDAGEDWPKIAIQYEKLAGVKTDCKSTLPNRYQRMKTNFVMINDEDSVILLEAKFRLDRELEEELWKRVANEVQEKTGNEYTPDALRRNYKRLMEHGDSAVAKAKKSLTLGGDEEGVGNEE